MKHKITKQDYYYQCGDGCCSWNATRWKLDGKEVYDGSDDDMALILILEALGLDATIAALDEENDEIWELP